MAVRHPAARLNQALRCFGELLERLVTGCGSDAESGARADHPALELGDFGECFFDRILDGADLVGDFEGGGFDQLFAHDSSPLDAGHPAQGHWSAMKDKERAA